jgi:hypothetical protein
MNQQEKWISRTAQNANTETMGLYLDGDNIDEQANEPFGCNNRPRTSTAIGQTMNLGTFEPTQ